MSDIQISASASAKLVAASSDLASTLASEPDEAFPEVFATSRMVALMELASARIMWPHLNLGELSVGVTIDIAHTAPTPLGATVTAVSRYIGRDGKLFVFEITAQDDAGEIGKGTHKRAIIATERLLSAAERRRANR